MAFIRLLRGRDAHDLMAYVNTYRTASQVATAEDFREAANLFHVKDVLES